MKQKLLKEHLQVEAINYQHDDIIKNKIGVFHPGHKGWIKFVIDCMHVGICPKCGDTLYVNMQYRKIIVVQCSNCAWEDSTEHNC